MKTTGAGGWQIWAPRPRALEVVFDGVRLPAEKLEDGTWQASPPPPDADYALSLDGGPPRPDPRSRLQPSGVHGRSRWVDTTFAWTDSAFRPVPLAKAVIYELHVGTFTPAGTLDSALEHLDDLISLGITHVELMPLAEFPGKRGWGYDCVDLYAVHTVYGGVDALRRFVNGAHAKGVSVILDVVYNHLGPDGNYLSEFGPFFDSAQQTPWGPAIDFSISGVRRFFLDNAMYWLRDCHLDGLRLDATHAMHDSSSTHILAELADEVRELDRPAVLIAENENNDPLLVRSRLRGGDGLDAFWFDDLHHAIHAAFSGERRGYYVHYGTLTDIATTLTGKGALNGHSLGPVDGRLCIACIQNHDQIGNRAQGERLGRLISPGRLRLSAALLLTAPFVPMLFQGEEWDASSPFQYFTDHQDEALAKAVVEGRRAEHASGGGEVVPDPQDPRTMRRSMLDWSERQRPPHREVLAWYRALLSLRHELGELSDGRRDQVEVAVDEDAGTIVVRRGRVTLIGNIGPDPLRIATPAGRLELSWPAAPRGDIMVPDSCALWVDRNGVR